MDAHLLHIASKSLDSLVGARISKIYRYDDDIYVFSLYGKGKKQYLTARTGKNLPFLFISDYHNARGETPPAHVMRLRKYLVGKRIINMYAAWWERIVFFQVSQEDKEPIWFKIDLKKGVDFCQSPYELYQKPEWKELENIDELKAILDPKLKTYPYYFTPPLRKTLQAMLEETHDETDAFLDVKSLIIDLESGEGDLFHYTGEDGKKEMYAWQLPKSLQEDKCEEIFDNPTYALNEYGKSLLLSTLTSDAKKQAAKPHLAQIKKLQTLKEKLDDEYTRLIDMYNKKELALKLQSNLYLFDKESKQGEIIIEGESYTINKKLTVRENMENLFHQSLRGKRGLVHVEVRKQNVEMQIDEEKEKLQQALLLSQVPKNYSISDNAKHKKEKTELNPKQKSKKYDNVPKQVLVRESVDGFTILLGKDVKGNGLALKMASPNDYWLHTADGASAHAIIKRDHAGLEIPQSTFDEAGRMVAEKSPFKFDEKALIQYAYAKNIQAMKKAGAGKVRIVKSEGSFWVALS